MKICKLHNEEKYAYKGFNLPEKDWTYHCRSCDKLGTSDGVPDARADDSDTLPIFYPADWDTSWVGVKQWVENEYRDACSELKQIGISRVEFNIRLRADYVLIYVDAWFPDGTQNYRGLFWSATPIPRAQAGAQPAGLANVPSSQPQHSTLTPLTILYDPAGDVRISFLNPGGGILSKHIRLPPDTHRPPLSSMTTQEVWALCQEQLRIEEQRSTHHSDKSSATSYLQKVQKTVDDIAPGWTVERRAWEENS